MNNRTIDELMTLLQQGVKSILDDDEYKRYLKLMARFPSYSVRNTLLIYQQNPKATMVAGYQTWIKVFGRYVKKGEKGIRILAPHTISVRDAEHPDDPPQKKTVFRSIAVFDVSQTEGKPLPERPVQKVPAALEGECPFLSEAILLLEELTGYSIRLCTLVDGTNGTTKYTQKTILIEQANTPAHQFKTLLHECAHALLHDFHALDPYGEDAFLSMLRENRSMREIEAESVACLVSLSLDLDSTGYSFPYIAAWSEQTELLPRSLERIAHMAARLLETLHSGLGLPDPAGVCDLKSGCPSTPPARNRPANSSCNMASA